MIIPNELLIKYGIFTLEAYEVFAPDIENKEAAICREFLAKTDYVTSKIIEAQILGTEIDDYTEILNYRQLARNEINRLETATE